MYVTGDSTVASLEHIYYRPQNARINEDVLDWEYINRKPIPRLPQIVWGDNTTWAEANIWSLEQATSSKKDLKTVHSNMSHLLAYAKWLESESITWWHFPERESERCLVRFRGALVSARNNGDLAPSTASQRMAAVIRFYKWMRSRRLISPEWPMWEQRVVGIKLTNAFGLEHTMRVASTDLAIANRKVAGAIQLEDGLLPVSVSAMKEIIALADRESSEELALMLRLGFFTGMRLGTITDLKVQTLENATHYPNAGWKRLAVGPGARPPLSQNNVAKEAGVDPSALRRARFPELVADIQSWIETHKGESPLKSPRQMMLAQRSRNRDLQEQNHAMKAQRDNALSQLLDAQTRILELTLENQRLRAQLPQSNVRHLSTPLKR